MYGHYDPPTEKQLLLIAISNGDIEEVARSLKRKIYHLTADAARCGKYEILKLMHKMGCRINSHTLYCAVIGRNVRCIKYCIRYGCELSTYNTRRGRKCAHLLQTVTSRTHNFHMHHNRDINSIIASMIDSTDYKMLQCSVGIIPRFTPSELRDPLHINTSTLPYMISNHKYDPSWIPLAVWTALCCNWIPTVKFLIPHISDNNSSSFSIILSHRSSTFMSKPVIDEILKRDEMSHIRILQCNCYGWSLKHIYQYIPNAAKHLAKLCSVGAVNWRYLKTNLAIYDLHWIIDEIDPYIN